MVYFQKEKNNCITHNLTDVLYDYINGSQSALTSQGAIYTYIHTISGRWPVWSLLDRRKCSPRPGQHTTAYSCCPADTRWFLQTHNVRFSTVKTSKVCAAWWCRVWPQKMIAIYYEHSIGHPKLRIPLAICLPIRGPAPQLNTYIRSRTVGIFIRLSSFAVLLHIPFPDHDGRWTLCTVSTI